LPSFIRNWFISVEILESTIFAYIWVVFNDECPNIFETVSIGTPFDKVTDVAKGYISKAITG